MSKSRGNPEVTGAGGSPFTALSTPYHRILADGRVKTPSFACRNQECVRKTQKEGEQCSFCRRREVEEMGYHGIVERVRPPKQ